MTTYQMKILELRLKGFSSLQIAEKLEVTTQSVYSQLSRMRKKGIMIKKEEAIKDFRNSCILIDKKKGLSIKEICKKYDISEVSFYRITKGIK